MKLRESQSNRLFLLLAGSVVGVLGFAVALPPFNVICTDICRQSSYPSATILWEIAESALAIAVLVGVSLLISKVKFTQGVLASRIALPLTLRIVLSVASVAFLMIFALAALTDIALVGGVDNEVGVQAAHPSLAGFYTWIFHYFGMLGNLGFPVQAYFSPNGVVFFEVFMISVALFFVSRMNFGLGVALQESVLFASLILLVFVSAIWWASPELLASKATQFSDNWRLGGVHLLSNLFVLVVSAFSSVALLMKRILA